MTTTEPTITPAPPAPLLPDYDGACTSNVVDVLIEDPDHPPEWFPDGVAGADQIVMLVLDGLGWDQLRDHEAFMPNLCSLTGGRITTVAPTTTATALSSISTGLTPGEHGLIGYRMVLGGEVMNVLRWAAGGENRRRSNVPGDVQRFPAFLGASVPVVSPAELADSAFTEAHLRGGRSVGYRAPSSMCVDVADQLAAIFYDEVIDPETGDVTVTERDEELRGILAGAWEEYTTSGSTQSFRVWLEDTGTHADALACLDDLRSLFRDVEIMGATQREQMVCMRRVCGDITPADMSDSELMNAIRMRSSG